MGLAVALVAIVGVAALPIIPPNPVPASALQDTFSAERAMEELRLVARAPHPAGSAQQARVREYILARAKTLGLPAETQRRRGVKSSAWGGWSGTVENVIVRVSGTRSSTPDVLITAHYDSVPVGPGAGGDGVSVAAMLETMRALEAGPPLKNDVVFLFTDGEEMGWLGAKAFAEQHPEMGNIGVAFVFEGWPSSGPTEMRATSPGDAWLVRQLSIAAPPVWANSNYNTDERLYHGSDFGVLTASGLLSAEFENSGSATRHHRPGDTVEAINPSIVQDHGDTMLTLARYFGKLDLGRAHSSSEDLVFFTLPGFGLVAYPTWFATGLSVVAVVLLVAIIVAARRQGHLSLAHLAWGTLAFFAVVLVSVAIAAGIWELLLATHPGAEVLSYPDFEGSGLAMAAIYASAGAAFIAVTHTISRRIGAVELAAGALLWWAVVALAVGLFAPLASALAIWPLVGGTVAQAVVSFLQRPWAAALLALAAVPSFVLFVPLLVLNALQPEDGAAEPVALLLLVIGTLVLQLMLITGRLPAEVKD